MRKRREEWIVLTLTVLTMAAPAAASGPSGGSPFAQFQVCKGGPNQGADCEFDVDCPKSKCVIDWVRGKGTTLGGTLTAFYDDQVRDFRDGVDTDNQAIVVTLEVKANGAKHLLSEVYQEADDPDLQPEVLGWGGVPFAEDDWKSLDCEDFLYARPEQRMAEALQSLAGLPPTKVAVVRSVKTKTESWDHANDSLGTALRCKVKIGFWNEP